MPTPVIPTSPISPPGVPPTVYAATVSGSPYLQSSGIVPASGVSGTYYVSGDWFIQEQTLNYSYARVPTGAFSSVSLNLSGVTISEYHRGTEFQIVANATVSVVKESGTIYSTSSWQQPQRFRVNTASADSQGYTYGDVSSGQFGPAGYVWTSQNWYHRRPWIEGTDSTMFSSMEGFNFVASNPLSGIPGRPLFLPAMDWFGIFENAWMRPYQRGSIIAEMDTYVQMVQRIGYLTGRYTSTSDPAVWSVTDQIADLITSRNLAASQPTSPIEDPDDLTAGFSAYSKSRHDFTT